MPIDIDYVIRVNGRVSVLAKTQESGGSVSPVRPQPDSGNLLDKTFIIDSSELS